MTEKPESFNNMVNLSIEHKSGSKFMYKGVINTEESKFLHDFCLALQRKRRNEEKASE